MLTSSSGERLYPVSWGHASFKKERAGDIVERANGTLSLPILSQDVGTRHANVDSMGEEEGAGAGVSKLTTIVALKNFDRGAELCGNEGKETRQSIKSVRFQAQRKCLEVVRHIIENHRVVFISRHYEPGKSRGHNALNQIHGKHGRPR